MPDIYLRAGESNASDIKLCDPTGACGGVSYFGILKRWTGAIWDEKPLKYWNGISWASKPLKVWDGATWQLIDIT